MRDFKQSLFISVWFMLLTFPIMVIRVNTIEKVVQWRWTNMAAVGAGAFILSYVWRYLMVRKESGGENGSVIPWHQRLLSEKKFFIPFVIFVFTFSVLFPLFVSEYRINVMITAMIYVVLGLGLNIVVGLAGLLDLGYVAKTGSEYLASCKSLIMV